MTVWTTMGRIPEPEELLPMGAAILGGLVVMCILLYFFIRQTRRAVAVAKESLDRQADAVELVREQLALQREGILVVRESNDLTRELIVAMRDVRKSLAPPPPDSRPSI